MAVFARATKRLGTETGLLVDETARVDEAAMDPMNACPVLKDVAPSIKTLDGKKGIGW